jgi:hypothetical protein
VDYPSAAYIPGRAAAKAEELTEINALARRWRQVRRANNYWEFLMEGHYHAVVWIDHRQARVFHFSPDDAEKVVVHPDRSPVREYHRTAKGSGQHDKEDQVFLEEVTKAIADAGAILIVGPANEKHELMKHIERVHPAMKLHVEGVESADHPTDGELVAHARRFLKSADRMRPQL